MRRERYPPFSVCVYTNGLLAKMIQAYFIILSTLQNTGVQPTIQSGNVSLFFTLQGIQRAQSLTVVGAP